MIGELPREQVGIDEPKAGLPPVPAFELSGVSYGYAGDVPALCDVSLTVSSGERLALLGANGSGKSTLLWVLAGLLEPSGGELHAFGSSLAAQLRDEAGTHAFRRRVGIVFQNVEAQLFSPTVSDEIAFGPLHLGLSRDEALARVADTMKLMEIETLAERAPYSLSGGEKKKVALAAALAVNPDVLLLDAPMSGLDPRSREWFVELLALLHAAGKTVVAATHDLDLLHEFADRAVVLDEEHRVAAEGSVSSLLADKDLLLSVNLIHEHVHRHGALLHSHVHAHPGERVHDAQQPAVHEHVHTDGALGARGGLAAGEARPSAGALKPAASEGRVAPLKELRGRTAPEGEDG